MGDLFKNQEGYADPTAGAAMKEVIKEARNLANAIVLSAVKDYRDALKKLKKKPNNKLAADERDDIERFFRSGYFAILTEIDPEYLIDRLNKEVFG